MSESFHPEEMNALCGRVLYFHSADIREKERIPTHLLYPKKEDVHKKENHVVEWLINSAFNTLKQTHSSFLQYWI